MTTDDLATPDAIFCTLVAEPLQATIGKILLHVNYWLINSDMPEFRVEAPNVTGLYAVSLVFRDRTLEIFPAWNKQLRGANAYHIQTRAVTRGEWSEEFENAELLAKVTADEVDCWRDVLGQPLTGVEVYGIGSTPNIIRFNSPFAAVAVAIGYSGDVPLLGDGDEILVYPRDQWRIAEETLREDWTMIWESTLCEER